MRMHLLLEKLNPPNIRKVRWHPIRNWATLGVITRQLLSRLGTVFPHIRAQVCLYKTRTKTVDDDEQDKYPDFLMENFSDEDDIANTLAKWRNLSSDSDLEGYNSGDYSDDYSDY